MAEPVILLERAKGYAVVTLNRPQAMNALSRELRRELAAVIDGLTDDPEVRVLILTGAGRAFCAGLDLKEIGAGGAGAPALSDGGIGDPCVSLLRFPGPVIGAVNGPAVHRGL